MKLFRRPGRRIVYLSRESDQVSRDVQMLSEEIRRIDPSIQHIFRFRMLHHGVRAKIRYLLGLIGDMYALAGAEVAICDTYSIPVSCLNHRKSLTIIQIWHSMGAIKKFGWQSVGKEEGRSTQFARALNMHKNYTYVLAPSKRTGNFYREAFDVSEQQIKVLTLPHIDYILDGKDELENFKTVYPDLGNKKIAVYVPTFRKGEDDVICSLATVFENDPEWRLFVSLHPLSTVTDKEYYRIKGNFTSFELMKIADCIITDYSACAFEAALLKKPLFFYVPDYDTYMNHRGVNINLLEEMSSACFDNAEKLQKYIHAGDYNFTQLGEFIDRYVSNRENCTFEMAKFILAQIH